jgi:hypothetical protein
MPIISSRGSGSSRGFGFGIGKAGPIANGGDIIATYGSYTYHTFLNSGTFTMLSSKPVEVLTIGGGGAGGGHHSTLYTTYGGGAGALLLQNTTLSPNTYSVTVGNGGSAPYSTQGIRGPNGSPSQFGSLTAAAGGGGGGASSGASAYFNSQSQDGSAGANGGNGGGGSPAGSGTQGFAGALGGGGGAGGAASSTLAGSGATYTDWFIASGKGVGGLFAGGGGSADYITVSGGGGQGGGPAPWGGSGETGIENTGGGGGGAGRNQDSFRPGGSGAKGIVIVRYLGSHPDAIIRTAPGSIPTNSGSPAIGGSASAGGTLTKTSDGSWSGQTSLEYKWQYSNDGSVWGDRTAWSATYSDYSISASSVNQAPWQYFTSYPVKNSTNQSYNLRQSLQGTPDQGLYYRLAVRGVNSNGKSSPAYSSASSQIPLIPVYSGGGSYTGSLSSGSTISATRGTWSATANQWLYQIFRASNSTGSNVTAFLQLGSTDSAGNPSSGWGNSFGRNYTIVSADRGSYLGMILTPIGGSISGGSGVTIVFGLVP